MFEAHSFSSQDFLESTEIALPCRRFTRTHKDSLQPLIIWFAEGRRTDTDGTTRKAIFVYTEYRDKDGNNRFSCQRYAYPDCLQQIDLDRYVEKAVGQKLK